jgi:hypothetical protein
MDRLRWTLPAETDRLLPEADIERKLDEVAEDKSPSDNWGWTFSLSSFLRLDMDVSFSRLDMEVSFLRLDMEVSFLK